MFLCLLNLQHFPAALPLTSPATMARKGAAPKKKMNRNVFLNLVLAAFSGLADSIWSGTVFVAYLYKLADGSNTKVGITAAVQGLSSLITALPAGWVSAAPCSRP